MASRHKGTLQRKKNIDWQIYIYIFGSHRLLQLKAATKRSGRIAHSVPIYEDDNIVYDICVGVCAVGTAVVDDTLCYDTPYIELDIQTICILAL